MPFPSPSDKQAKVLWFSLTVLAIAVFLALLALMFYGVGWLLDRFGARVVITAIGLLLGLAALWMSTVDSQLELYAGFAALRVLGQGSLTMATSTLVAIWFVRRRGGQPGIRVDPGPQSDEGSRGAREDSWLLRRRTTNQRCGEG